MSDSREHAVLLYNQALSLMQSDPVTAYRCAASSVEVDEAFADGWLLVGMLLADMGNLAAACAAYRAGLRCPEGDDKGDLTPVLRHKFLVNLGHRLLGLDDLAAAETVTDEAIRFYGRTPDGLHVDGAAKAHTNRSLIYSHRGSHGAAVVEARRGFEMFDCPETEMSLAFAHLFEGDYASGLLHFERRFDYKLQQYNNLPYPRFDWVRDVDRTLIVLCEMGLGDSLSFARFIPKAAEIVNRLIFQVQPGLAGLLEHAFPENVEVVPQSYVLPRAHAWCPVFSVPVALDLATNEIRDWPGLDPARLTVSRDIRLGHGFSPDNFNIAIAYAGAPASDIDGHRSIPPEMFLPLLDVPGVRLWSVQTGDRVQALHQAGMVSMVHDLSPWIRDCRDTAAILRQVDLTICCESFVGHLCGALEVECWVAASKMGRDWRIGTEGDRALWYPGHRVFRQGDDRSWRPVFAAMCKALRERLAWHGQPEDRAHLGIYG